MRSAEVRRSESASCARKKRDSSTLSGLASTVTKGLVRVSVRNPTGLEAISSRRPSLMVVGLITSRGISARSSAWRRSANRWCRTLPVSSFSLRSKA